MPRLFLTCHVTVRDVCKTWCERAGGRAPAADSPPPHTQLTTHDRAPRRRRSPRQHAAESRHDCRAQRGPTSHRGHPPPSTVRYYTLYRYVDRDDTWREGRCARPRGRVLHEIHNKRRKQFGFLRPPVARHARYIGLASRGSPRAFDGRAEVGELEHQVFQARVELVEESLAVDWARRA